MKYFIVSLLVFWGYVIYFPVNASAQTLDVETFIQMVVKYHPVVKRANLDISISESELLQSRGAFDPQLKSSFSRKDMGGITYYNYQQTELKIPTWYGIEIAGGIESVYGSSTDPQETKGESSYIGISLPVLQNLLLDKRRAALQKARIMVDYSKNEQLAVINDILLEALLQYWEWVRLDQELNMLLSVKQNIEQRLNFTNTTIAIGERAPIDSLEAQAQLLFIEGLENELQVAVRNAKITLSAYTWTENGQAVNLPQDLKPAEGLLQIDNIRFEAETQQFFEQEAMRNHPELQAYPIKLQYLEVDKRWAFQQLLPKLDLKYNQLGKGFNLLNSSLQPLLQNNFQYGVQFSMPLRLSEGRGQYRIAKYRIQQTELDRDLKQKLIQNKVSMEFQQLTQIQKQLAIQQSLLRNQEGLLDGENIRFTNGESSLFLVNNREQKVIETKQKLIALSAKYLQQKIKLRWASGILSTIQ